MKTILDSFLLSGVLLATAGLAQQNLIPDGGFDKGMGNWTFGGGKFYAGFENYDCNGTGVLSQSFAVTPDATGNLFFLRHTVTLKKGVKYFLRFDCVGTGTLPKNVYSKVDVYIGTKSYPFAIPLGVVYPHPYTIPNTGRMIEYGVPFVPPINYDTISIRFHTSRRASLGFKIYIDNVSLFEQGVLPWSHCKSYRNLSPKNVSIESYGKKSELYLMFLGTKKLTSGVPIGGVIGLLEMDPSGGMFMVGNGIFNSATGRDTLTLPIPAEVLKAIKGKPIFWMPVQVTSFPKTITLGKVATWGFL